MAAPATLSIPDVERLLVEKKHRLDSLIGQRDELQQEIEDLDQQIQEAGNLDGPFRRRGRRRFTNSAPIRVFVRQVLQKHKQGLRLHELAEQVIAAGYQTESQRFEHVIYQCLLYTRHRA